MSPSVPPRSLIRGHSYGLCFPSVLGKSTLAVRCGLIRSTFQLLHHSSKPLLHPIFLDFLKCLAANPAAPRFSFGRFKRIPNVFSVHLVVHSIELTFCDPSLVVQRRCTSEHLVEF